MGCSSFVDKCYKDALLSTEQYDLEYFAIPTKNSLSKNGTGIFKGNNLSNIDDYYNNNSHDQKINGEIKSTYKSQEGDIDDKSINNKQLIEEFSKKEKEYQEKIKELKEIIANNKKPILVGLNNIGATCYMNATLQCLSNTKKLTEYFSNRFKNDDPNKIMTNEYYKVIFNLWKRENNNKSYSPFSFEEVLSKENPLFAGIAANDSKDLINFLLERFHKELNIINTKPNNNNQANLDQTNEQTMFNAFLEEYSKNFNSPISNLFYGILETKSQCKGCNIVKYNFQIFSFLEFPLQQVNLYFYNKGKRPLILENGKNPDIDLYECFEYNEKNDLKTGENQMYCNNCNKLCDATYSVNIYSFPNYLIINLNRGKTGNYECAVIIPEQLNVLNYAKFKKGVTIYELYAVICHLRPISMNGSFVAYCKNSIDNKWYLYDDAIVSLCTRPYQYNDGIPYMLFYKATLEGA